MNEIWGRIMLFTLLTLQSILKGQGNLGIVKLRAIVATLLESKGTTKFVSLS